MGCWCCPAGCGAGVPCWKVSVVFVAGGGVVPAAEGAVFGKEKDNTK